MEELSLLAQASVVLVLALTAARVAQRAPAALRACLLASTFAVLPLLPVAALTVPKRTIEIAVPATSLLTPPAADDVVTAAPVRSPEEAGPPVPQPWRISVPPLSTALRVAWALGLLVLLARLAIALVRLRIMRRRGLHWPDGQALVDATAGRAGVGRRVSLFLHQDLSAPVTCGILRPSVGLPVDAPEWTATELRHALIHELEHVRRGDWAIQLLARGVCAIYWFHPLVWMTWRRLCVESERACDDAVLRAAERTEYAEQLVSLARRLKSSPAPLLSMADRSDLATRVHAVLDAAQARGPVRAVTAVLVLCVAIGLTAAISPLQAIPSPRLPEDNARGLAFEVASIRINESADGPRGILPTPGGRFTALGLTVRDFIALAYGSEGALFDDQIVGGPDWISTRRFDIIATEDPAAAPQMAIQDRLYAMLRTLLVERFGLQFRRESRELPIFDLVLANGARGPGPRLRPTRTDCAALARNPMSGCGFRRVAAGLLTAEGLEMGSLAGSLSRQAGVRRIVRDRTGLEGRFDLELEFTPDVLNAGVTTPQPDPAGAKPTLLTALQEQLGLRLEAARGLVEVFVIENAQQPSPDDGLPAAPKPQASTAAPDTFEVVSIRRNRSTDPARARVEPGGRFTAINVPVAQIVRQAYGVRPFQVLNAPDWTAAERFDIIAKAPEGVSFGTDTVALFLRGLLRDRFAFSARTETHDMPIYALVASRPDRQPGRKLETSAVDCTRPVPAPAAERRDPDKPLCAMLGQWLGSNNRRYEMRGYPMARFAEMLGGAVDRLVVDRSGLTGTWNLELDFGAQAVSPSPDDLPSIFTALEEQLGLKLEPARGPVDMLVIARIERPAED